ncbi:MAG: hypothetical protein JXA06_01615 [Bacteroidetes bacterium]|nr:hypothetical protein [Bacteroidota bacterium]
MDKEKEQKAQLELLRKGVGIDIIEMCRKHIHPSQPLFEKVKEARIDPDKKRLALHIDFPELNEENLKDDTAVLRLNRQIYDFFQILNAKPWLKPYSPHYETYFLICRTTKKIQDGTEILYPFMKVEAKISELRKLEGAYFNPRRLSEIAELYFNGGAQV